MPIAGECAAVSLGDTRPRGAIERCAVEDVEVRRREAESAHCDLCGAEDFETIGTRDRLGQALATVVCRRCGLVRHAALPSAAELSAFYGKEYRRRYHGEWTPSARRVMRAWRNAERIYRQLEPFLSSYAGASRSMLDVGTGIGCLPKLFELNGWEACGLEPNEGFQTYGATRLRAPVVRAELDALEQWRRWDLITLVHVIEHLRTPLAALAQIRRRLNPGGLLYIECPNLAAPHAVRSRLFHYAHIYNFTPITLTWAARRVGFAPIARFGRPDDANLQMLFVMAEPQEVTIDDRGYCTTRDALRRAEALRYYARPFYWHCRIRKLAGYFWEHFAAPSFVRRLEARLGHGGGCGDVSRSDVRAA